MEKYFEYFYDISSIPHGSGNTKKISDYLFCFAKERNLYVRQDEFNNIVIVKEASAGYEDHEAVILQGHMDMVTVKTSNCTKDMLNEGLDIYIEDDFLKAKETSLGGDDGIAVAYILAILDGDYKAPKIEAVFTVDEEIGMLGATNLDVSDITGKRLINIDQEEEGIFIVGCAGGVRMNISLPVNKLISQGSIYDISVTNLKGGHSGIDINKNRGNAIIILANELKKLYSKVKFNLIQIDGGVADNAIPNEAIAKIQLKDTYDNALFEKEILKLNGQDMYFGDTKDYDQAIVNVSKNGYDSMIILDDESTDKTLAFLNELPYGVIAMSENINDMVETSINTGIVKSQEESIDVAISIRSSIKSAKDEQIFKLCKVANVYGAKYELKGDYPGWSYEKNSELVDIMTKNYEDMFAKKPEIQIIHAGLECGIFKEKINDLQCISIGPDILDIHSVNERLPIASADRCFNYLVKCLESL